MNTIDNYEQTLQELFQDMLLIWFQVDHPRSLISKDFEPVVRKAMEDTTEYKIHARNEDPLEDICIYQAQTPEIWIGKIPAIPFFGSGSESWDKPFEKIWSEKGYKFDCHWEFLNYSEVFCLEDYEEDEERISRFREKINLEENGFADDPFLEAFFFYRQAALIENWVRNLGKLPIPEDCAIRGESHEEHGSKELERFAKETADKPLSEVCLEMGIFTEIPEIEYDED